MIPLSLTEVAELCGGTVGGDHTDLVVRAAAVVDSRLAMPGCLYVAVRGERADGHDFVAAAFDNGAVAALVSRLVTQPHVLVDDTVAALGLVARGVLNRLTDLIVVGLTGSSGKTSTKDLLAQLLAAAGPTIAPEGSFNNEVGVPLTALRADADTACLVVEMGARGVGHIAALCDITPPRIGLVLNVGSAHAGEFGSREATAAAKSELVAALPAADEGGVAVLNADDPLVAAMASKTSARVVRFGRSESADVRASDLRLDDRGRPSFLLHAPGAEPVPVQLPLHGAHHVANALAAATVALEVGLAAQDIADTLSRVTVTSSWRMEVTERTDGVTVVNDAYNANPESMRAALEALAAMAGGRRTWAVLGEMRELGAASHAEHEAAGRLARRVDVDRLVVVGEGARGIHTGAVAAGAVDGEESVVVADVAAALATLGPALLSGDVVLVKASRSVGLERVAAALLDAVDLDASGAAEAGGAR